MNVNFFFAKENDRAGRRPGVKQTGQATDQQDYF